MNKKLFIPGVFFAILSIISAIIAIYIYTDDGKIFKEPDLESSQSVSVGSEISGDYVSPIDFNGVEQTNSELYAWLSIDGTDISHPVAQSKTNDNYYLKRAPDKKYSINGTLFTQKTYNNLDFNDPVTVIYGHDMKSGAMFGKLQELFSDEQSFEKLKNSLVVYLPDRELHYEVFAAVPYSERHILHYYDKFETPETVDEFIDEIYSVRAFGANFTTDIKIKNTDKLLVLSTCLKGDISKRFLVVSRLKATIK